ncbi:thioredoxin, mitochondrial [Drosophila sulfurigaster albostrigata]|uniref:thioredoxin, mitochondrial n=1 Tax=Drosophila sulfurigaster albostrigata TaxID=89887 RepID=UPI002D21AE30|nr:thioredoxin, mitochondrial [Drosophila sulfurigaster albostrigata]
MSKSRFPKKNLINYISRLSHVAKTKPVANRNIFDVQSVKEFEKKVKRSDKPVIVDFHASWCTPCKALAPRIANLVNEQRGRVHLARVDIDELTDLALDYKVASVPSLMVMHNGKVLNRMVGLQTSEYLRDWLNEIVRRSNKEWTSS